MNGDADRNGSERQTISKFGRSRRTAHQFGADLQSARGDDVSLLAVFVFQQRNASGATRIVFNRGHGRFHAVFLPFEIDEANLLFVTATDASGRGATIMI